ncbi:hypothetical protein [Halopseudomonas salegens]|nr:hypothetical protein [Halopseudomonas salegens]
MPVNVGWQVSRTESDAATRAGPVTRQVSSPGAVLQIDGATVATVGGLLSQTSALTAGQSGTLTFNETLQVNVGLARRIADSPAGSVRIVRVFSDGQREEAGSLAVYAGGSGEEGLTVSRIDLTFEDASRTDVVGQRTELRAVADVSFRSSGVLQGEWRVIDPTASLGSGAGRVLQVVRQSLVSAGEGKVRVVSPLLPTERQGLYLLAFSVRDTSARMDIPILRYFVIDNSQPMPVADLPELVVDQPRDNALLDHDTTFAWQPVSNAHAYQVEIFARGGSVPLSGKLVPSADLSMALSNMTLDWLSSGTSYQWQLRAFDSEGRVIAISPRKPARTPDL